MTLTVLKPHVGEGGCQFVPFSFRALYVNRNAFEESHGAGKNRTVVTVVSFLYSSASPQVLLLTREVVQECVLNVPNIVLLVSTR